MISLRSLFPWLAAAPREDQDRFLAGLAKSAEENPGPFLLSAQETGHAPGMYVQEGPGGPFRHQIAREGVWDAAGGRVNWDPDTGQGWAPPG